MAGRTAAEWLALHDKLIEAGDTETAGRIRQGLIQQGVLAPESAPAAPVELGAPWPLRSIVDSARSPQDRLASLQARYPDAQMTPDGNMVYSDESGRQVLYNKPGLDWGDTAQLLRAVPEGLGALIGGTIGAPAGPVGLFGGAAAGGALAGQIYDAGLTRYGGVQDTRGIKSRLLDTATDLAANALGAPARPASTVIEAGNELQEQIARSAANREADLAGVPLSAAQRRQNPEGWLGRIENKLETSIGGGGVIHKQREKAAEALQEFATKATPDATGSPMAAGEALSGGITRRTEQRRRVQEGLYARAERLLDPDAGIDLPAMRQLLADVQRERASGGLIRSAVEDSNLAQLERALMDAGAEDADASFRSLKAYRTRIGEQIRSPLLQSAGSGQGNLKRIYGAASDDRANAAFQLGGAQAREAWSKADRFTRALETDLSAVDKLTKGSPAEVFRRFERAMLRDPTKAKQMLEAATPAARERVLQEVIYRLGRAKPGAQDVSGEVFSPATFSTNWAKLKQEAPEVLGLFSPEQRRALATLSQVSDSLKAAMKGRNTSRTAATTWTGAGAGAGGVGGALGGVGGALEAGAIAASVLAAVGGVQWLAAKALTSQGFAKALGDLDPKVFGRPMGDLLKALAAAGASEADINQLRTATIDAQHGMPADRPPAPPRAGIGVAPRGALQ